MAYKNVIADMVKREKLNGDNYDIWRRKIQFALNDYIDHLMTEPKRVLCFSLQGSVCVLDLDLDLDASWP